MKQKNQRKCRHCTKRLVSRPRGLCWNCFYTPGIVAQYPGKVRRGVPDAKQKPLPPKPTRWRPGTPEKYQVLIERAEAGYQLFHPDDAD